MQYQSQPLDKSGAVSIKEADPFYRWVAQSFLAVLLYMIRWLLKVVGCVYCNLVPFTELQYQTQPVDRRGTVWKKAACATTLKG